MARRPDPAEDPAVPIEVDGEFCIPGDARERRHVLDDRPSVRGGRIRAAVRKLRALGRPGRAPA